MLRTVAEQEAHDESASRSTGSFAPLPLRPVSSELAAVHRWSTGCRPGTTTDEKIGRDVLVHGFPQQVMAEPVSGRVDH
jgi:hypothetical protein